MEIVTGKEVAQLSEDFKTVEGLAFSPDGRSLLIGSKDSKLRIWKPALNGE
jgi:WD40 repeat protein